MKRRLFNILAGLSLLIGAAFITLWAYSRSYDVECGLCVFRHDLGVEAVEGVVILNGFRGVPELTGLPIWTQPNLSVSKNPPGMQLLDTDYNFLGFGFGCSDAESLRVREAARQASSAASGSSGSPQVLFPVHRLVVPLWFFVALSAILPVLRGFNYFFGRKRSAKGLCATCGYDLRATPERCPECGTVAVKPGREMKGA